MKNKFLKTLGVAGLVACSLFTLIACTQDETQTNNSNQQQVVQIKDELTKQEAFDLLQEAETRLLLNYNNCWDGMKVSVNNSIFYEYIQDEDENHVEYHYYKDGY